jgi:hypothetical protein
MTVTIELAPDIEAGLVALAKAQGLGLPQYVERVLKDQISIQGGGLSGVIVDSSRNPTLSRCQRPVAPTDFVVLPLGKGCLGQVRGMKNILLDGPRRADAAPLGNQNPFAEQGRRKL